MLTLLIIVLALGVILETISLRRDPDKVELGYVLSSVVTEPGAPFTVQAVITNKSRIPVSYLALRELYPVEADMPEGMSYRQRRDGIHIKKVCRVSGRQRKRLVQETAIGKRGVYTFKGDSIEFGDFLGFQEIMKSLYLGQEIVVYPERLECPDLTDTLGAFCGDINSRRFLIRDPLLTVGCREYTGREPMKEIHWLQSARQGGLMVREFDYNRQLSVCVILGVDASAPPAEDALDNCCSAARTVCEVLVGKGVSVGFYTNAVLRHKSVRGFWRCEVSAGHTGGLLEGLGRVSGYASGPLEGLLEHARRGSSSDSAFVVILPDAEGRGAESVNRLRRVTGQEVLLIGADSLRQEPVGSEPV